MRSDLNPGQPSLNEQYLALTRQYDPRLAGVSERFSAGVAQLAEACGEPSAAPANPSIAVSSAPDTLVRRAARFATSICADVDGILSDRSDRAQRVVQSQWGEGAYTRPLETYNEEYWPPVPHLLGRPERDQREREWVETALDHAKWTRIQQAAAIFGPASSFVLCLARTLSNDNVCNAVASALAVRELGVAAARRFDAVPPAASQFEGDEPAPQFTAMSVAEGIKRIIAIRDSGLFVAPDSKNVRSVRIPRLPNSVQRPDATIPAPYVAQVLSLVRSMQAAAAQGDSVPSDDAICSKYATLLETDSENRELFRVCLTLTGLRRSNGGSLPTMTGRRKARSGVPAKLRVPSAPVK